MSHTNAGDLCQLARLRILARDAPDMGRHPWGSDCGSGLGMEWLEPVFPAGWLLESIFQLREAVHGG